ncbi:MAG: hypothetical protein HZB11_00750 [Candidatus Yonathbacteria bacterium]|nr:hypothetical protein [Candidatus Yonathbacteria bacterium]
MKKFYLNIAGAVLLFAALLNIYAQSGTEGFKVLLWYCDFSAILGATGIFLRRNYIINAVLFTAIPVTIPWIFDFIVVLFGGDSLGFSKWVFGEKNMLIVFSTIFLHSILIPIAFYGTYVLGFSKKSFLFAIIIYGVFLMPITYSLTDRNMNTNCLFNTCGLLQGRTESPLVYLLHYYSRYFLLFCTSFFGVMVLFNYIFKRNLFRGAP